jgi:class 3 adenylate cyclase
VRDRSAERIAEYNSELPENQRMRFRIGVNLGEVVVDGATIHGDGSTSRRVLRSSPSRAGSSLPAACTII